MLWSVCFGLLLFANTADCSADCQIYKIFLPRSISSITGPRYLNCSVEHGKIASMIAWKSQDQTLKQAAGPITWLGLSLDKTAVKRAKDFRCEVMVGKRNSSCGFSREVPPHITSRKQLYVAYGGTSLSIPCRATGSPEPRFAWIKRAQSLATQDMPRSIQQVKSRDTLTLVIKKVSMNHSGIYTCHVVNRLGKDTHLVIVLVAYQTLPRQPRMLSLKHIVTVQKGSTAVLSCSAKNTPQRYTAVFWDHYGTMVKTTARHHIKSRYSVKILNKKYKDERVDTSLIISHVTFKDVGLYTCGVVTHVGRDEDHVALMIR